MVTERQGTESHAWKLWSKEEQRGTEKYLISDIGKNLKMSDEAGDASLAGLMWGKMAQIAFPVKVKARGKMEKRERMPCDL